MPLSDVDSQPTWDIEVFLDGDCPLFRTEIEMLRRWDRKERIQFTNITAAGFDPTPWGVQLDDLMADIHGRLPDGSWIRGVEVFRRLYSAVGFGSLVAVSRWPGVRHRLDLGYRLFARHRLRLTGRCSTTCRRGPRP